MRPRGGPGRRSSIDAASPHPAASAGPPHARRAYSTGVLAIVLLVGLLALAGCGGDDGGGSASATTAAPETTSAPTTTAAAGGTGEDEFQLTASNFAWDKTSLQMTAGSQVKVEVSNQDQAPHSFTFQDAGVDQEVPAGEDATATFTAPDAGSYQFRCKFHASMTGTVTVT
jgi:plastocyanin